MSAKPVILITNDDGIEAPGLAALISVVRPFGDVVVVASDRPQSGSSHSVTMHHPIRLNKLSEEPGLIRYSCNGTPVDAVKLAHRIVMGSSPDLLLSGINHGTNASINIIYSGTMAAAFEGAMSGIPSIGFSLLDPSPDADFSASCYYAEIIIRTLLQRKGEGPVCLNVNIPRLPVTGINGIRICRQAEGTWVEDFDIRHDPKGLPYYWLKGVFTRIGDGDDTDEWALEHGYVSVVPVHVDFTDYSAMAKMKQWKFIF